MNRVLLRIVCVFFLGVLFFPPAKSHAELEAYDVGIFMLPPWGERDDNGQIKGVIYEFFKLIEKESGLTFRYKLLPYARMINGIQKGEIDIAIFLERSIDEPGITRIALTHYEEIVIYCSKSEHETKWEDIRDVTMAVPLGVNFGEKFKKNPHIKKQYIKYYRNSIKMFLDRRVDSFIGPKSAVFYNFMQLGVDWTKFPVPFTLGYQQAFLHASNKNMDNIPIQKLEKAVRRLRQDGKLHKVLMRYYGTMGITYAPLPALMNYSN